MSKQIDQLTTTTANSQQSAQFMGDSLTLAYFAGFLLAIVGVGLLCYFSTNVSGIAGINNGVGGLSKVTATNTEKLKTLNSTIGELNTQISEHSTTITRFANSNTAAIKANAGLIEGLTKNVKTLSNNQEAIEGLHGASNELLQQQTGNLGTLAENLQNVLRKLETSNGPVLQQLQKNLTTLIDRLDTLPIDVVNQLKGMEQLNADADSIVGFLSAGSAMDEVSKGSIIFLIIGFTIIKNTNYSYFSTRRPVINTGTNNSVTLIQEEEESDSTTVDLNINSITTTTPFQGEGSATGIGTNNSTEVLLTDQALLDARAPNQFSSLNAD